MPSIYSPDRGSVRYDNAALSGANITTTGTVLFWYSPTEALSSSDRTLLTMDNLFRLYIPANTATVALQNHGTSVFEERLLTNIITLGVIRVGVRFSTDNPPRVFLIKADGVEVFRSIVSYTTLSNPTSFEISSDTPNGCRGYIGGVRLFKKRMVDPEVRNYFNLQGSCSYDLGDVAIAWDFTEFVNNVTVGDQEIKNVVGNLNGVNNSQVNPDGYITSSSQLPLYYRRR